MRRELTGGLCALMLWLAATGAATAAAPDRAAALAGYRSVEQATRVAAGWSGSGCTVGSESPASLAATLHSVNVLRAFAGAAPVAFDDQLNAKALAAATMMRAAGRLSHGPGPDWPCYSEQGAEGAGRSNLSLGRSSAAAMVGYVDDDGVASLGHRRWLLNPQATVFGSGSTGSTNALYVVTDGSGGVLPDQALAWPPTGWVPWQWIFSDWSLAFGAPGQIVTLQAPQVGVTIDGAPAAVSGIEQLGEGYGAGPMLKWRVSLGEQLRRGDHTLVVTVAGIVADGRPLTASWKTSVFQPDPPPAFTRGPLVRRPGGARVRLRPGQQLRASATISGGRASGYQWLRGGRAISGAFRRSYRIQQRDRGRGLSVRVTASPFSGEFTTVRTSPAVRVSRFR